VPIPATGGQRIGHRMISRRAGAASFQPATCAVAPSREWRLPSERALPPFRRFTNILLAAVTISGIELAHRIRKAQFDLRSLHGTVTLFNVARAKS
jgi:hypothetical protein